MKKLLLAAGVAVAFGLATTSFGLISGSAHDFSGDAWNAGGEICEPCHTPHNGDMAVVELWNHTNSTASFTVYTGNGNFDGGAITISSVSLACLSCHDGTVSLDQFGTGTGSTTISGTPLLGTDLSNDHPVSFTYNTGLATTDGELHDPAATASGVGTGNIDDDMLFGASNDQLECASCHDVHNTAGLASLLIKDNAGSGLCLTCHNK